MANSADPDQLASEEANLDLREANLDLRGLQMQGISRLSRIRVNMFILLLVLKYY